MRAASLIYIAFLVTATLASCNKEYSHTVIEVDLSEAVNVSLEGVDETRLMSQTVLGKLIQIIVNDTLILVKTPEGVRGFSSETGEETAVFSRKGRAADEYLNAWNVGFEDGLPYILDIDSKKMMYFNHEGGMIESKNLPMSNPFQHIVKLDKGRYLGKRMYGTGHISELSLYNADLQYVSDFGDLILRSGSNFGFPFYRNENGDVYYNRDFLNEIYRVADDDLKLFYTIDFGDNNIPGLASFEDEMEIIMYSNQSVKEYATMVSGIYDSKKYFCFTFVFSGKRGYAVYDKTDKSVTTYLFKDAEYMTTSDDAVYIFSQTEENGTCFSRIALDKLQDYFE